MSFLAMVVVTITTTTTALVIPIYLLPFLSHCQSCFGASELSFVGHVHGNAEAEQGLGIRVEYVSASGIFISEHCFLKLHVFYLCHVGRKPFDGLTGVPLQFMHMIAEECRQRKDMFWRFSVAQAVLMDSGHDPLATPRSGCRCSAFDFSCLHCRCNV